MSNLIIYVPVFTLVGGAVAVLLADLLPYSRVHRWVAVGAVGTSFTSLLFLTRYSWPLEATLFTWQNGGEGMAPVAFSYYLDGVSFALLVLALFGSFALVLYAAHYVAVEPKRQLVFYVSILLATAAFANMVLSGDLIMTYIGLQTWIVASFAIVAFWHHGPATTPAILRSFVLTALPSTGVLAAILVLASRNPSLAFSAISPQSVSLPLFFLFVVSAAAVSCQYPFHPWTAINYRVPLPASALLGLVLAPFTGVYLLARSHAISGSQIDPLWHQSLMVIGALTMVAGSVYTIKQTHLRGITIFIASAQFGYAFLGLGINTPTSIAAGLLVLFSSSLACCGMMICSGIIERSTGTGNVLKLGGLAKRMPRTAILVAFFSLSLAGIPFPALGFFAKWALLGAAIEAGHVAFGILTIVIDVLVFAMLLRTIDWVFFRKQFRKTLEGNERDRIPLVSAALLATPLLLFGFAPFLIVDWLVKPALSVILHIPVSELNISLAGGFTSGGFFVSAASFLLMLVPPVLGLTFYMVAVGDGKDEGTQRASRGLQGSSGADQPEVPVDHSRREPGTGNGRPTEAAKTGGVSVFPWIINTSGMHLAIWRMLIGLTGALRSALGPAETKYSPVAILLAALTILLALLE